MSRNIVETALGAVVLVVAIAFVAFAYSTAKGSIGHGYQLTAKFDHIDGTQVGGDVRISGIKVGTILSQTLDPKTFQAIVTLRVDDTVKVPVDTIATITSSGLLGDSYLQLVPGGDDNNIPPGGQITNTQAPVSLQSMLGQALFSVGGGGAKAAPAGAPPAPSPSAGSSPGPTPSQGPAH